MAQLGISLLGAGIGGVFGGVTGARIGWMIGSIIGRILFPPPKQIVEFEGPRLLDTAVISSAFGTPIPIAYGTVRLPGMLIWSTGIREEKIVTETTSGGGGGKGKGKGGGGVTTITTTFKYFATFSMAFAEGVGDRVMRMWADGKLIFSNQEDTQKSADFSFRFYPGDEVQLPDSLMEADKGAGNVSGHRGLCHILFDDMPLENYGNRIPNLTAEISFVVENQLPTAPTFPITLTDPNTQNPVSTMLPVFRKGIFYGASGTTGFAVKYSLLDVGELLIGTEGWPGTRHVDEDGFLYGLGGSGNSKSVIRYDPDTMLEIGRVGDENANLTSGPTSIVHTVAFADFKFDDLLGAASFLVCQSIFDDISVIRTDKLTGMDIVTWLGGTQGTAPAGIVSDDSNNVWVLTRGGDSHFLYRVSARSIQALPGEDNTEAFISVPLATFDSAVEFGTGGATIIKLFYPAENALLLWHAATTQYAKLSLDTLTIDFKGPTDAKEMAGQNKFSRINGGIVRYTSGATPEWVVTLNLDDLTQELLDADLWRNEFTNGSFYDSETDSIYVYYSTTDIFGKLNIDRFTITQVGTFNILKDLCRRAGLDPDVDIDVSEVTDNTVGYIVSPQMPVRNAIAPLGAAYFFDGVESDDKIKFIKRGATSIRTIQERDLGTRQSKNQKNKWEQTRTQEADLPEVISVTFFDQSKDYQTGLQHSKRVSLPFPTMSSKDKTSLNLALVFPNTTEPKQISEKQLFTSWAERVGYKTVMPWTHIDLDPTDIVIVNVAGRAYQVRLILMDIGLNMALNIESLSDDSGTVISTAVGADPLGVPQQTIPPPIFINLFILDTPLLRDVDASGGLFGGYYFAMGVTTSFTWPGGSLFRSADRTNWQQVATLSSEVVWGTAITALGATVDFGYWDDVNSVTVAVISGSGNMVSVTDLDMVNGANAALLGSELFQYGDVVDNGDGTFVLSHLLRGRRGTEREVSSHVPGDRFLLISQDTFGRATMSLSDLNTLKFYKAVTIGDDFESVSSQSVAITGNDLRPYAPAHMSVTLSGNDIVVAWRRRTRVGGSWRDGIGVVPFAETIDQYEIDFEREGVVVRTQVVDAATTYTYIEADQAADSDLPTPQNLGAETGDATGWTLDVGSEGGVHVFASIGSLSPHTGSFFFGRVAAMNQGHWGYFQVLDLVGALFSDIDTGAVTVDYTAWQGGYNTTDGTGHITLKFLDIDDVQLGSDEASPVQNIADATWTQVTAASSVTLPKGTRKVRLEMVSTKVTDIISNQCFDDLVLSFSGMRRGYTVRLFQMSSIVGRGFERTAVDMVTLNPGLLNLRFETIEVYEDDKESTFNDLKDNLDRATQDNAVIDVSSTGNLDGFAGDNVHVTLDEYRQNVLLVLDDTASDLAADFNLFVPDGRRLFVVDNPEAFDATVDTETGSVTPIIVAANERKVILSKGTDLVEVDTPTLEEVRLFVEGKPTAAEIVLHHVVAEPFTLRAGLPGSEGFAGVDPDDAGGADFDVLKNGASVGTVSFAQAVQVATFTLSSATSFAPGDRLEVTAPSPADADLQDISITLLAVRG